MFNRRVAILSAIAFSFGLFLTACSGKPEDKIVGKWAVDVESTVAAEPKAKEMPEEEKAKLIEQTKAFLGNASFEFTKDGKFIAKMGDKEESVAYKVVKTEGNTVTIETTQGEGEAAKTEQGTITVEGDKLTMKQGNMTMVLKKM